ncbi:adenylate/guanylate cyclase [Tistlia consotensis]|uniref:Adenylate/guanylate cyclase n=1 Tax=Tistlia consotensis USBA 355 TaxID=560819 RepID=A0A1Y6C6C4_9PROT|nr:adenylate/guanylate cyclase domain-containing protein [Tistlia consotensis]SMF46413.1 adenylate/guanylate cyclase [Tistlia consotensis USBA 355]SNR78469.1 adenylate/guanylate cyclase [Tistlia consotensis]
MPDRPPPRRRPLFRLPGARARWIADPHLAQAVTRAERAGVAFSFQVRAAVLLLVAVWLAITVPMPRVFYWHGMILLFLLSGLIPYRLRHRSHWRRWLVGFTLLDAALLTTILILPNPFYETGWPIQTQLRFHNQLYLFVFLAGALLSYSPGMVLWTGLCIAASWSVGTWLIARLPGSILALPPTVDGKVEGSLSAFLDPRFVDLNRWANEVVLLLIVALVGAVAVWRARRLLHRQIDSERARSHLSRYFSPDVADRLAREGGRLETAEERPVAVLFVDIVGFTGLSEGRPAEQVVTLLRSFRTRMARCVFAHGGTLDKYVGDEVMATFGTLGSGRRDAANAIACGLAMLGEVERWNAKRRQRGTAEIAVGVGIHYGPCVVGNVGSASQLEFTCIGDAVNCAQRLERLTRELGTPIIVSEDAMAAARRELEGEEESLARFAVGGTHPLRGRLEEVPIWHLEPDPAGQTKPSITPLTSEGSTYRAPSTPVASDTPVASR